MRPPMDVCLTFDVEFSVSGAFARHESQKPKGIEVVECRAGGEEHGLGFILDTLNRHSLKATFFVETANVSYFGAAPMGEVVRRLLAAGQDVQMHLHPAWSVFKESNWRDRILSGTPVDRCADLPIDNFRNLLNEGKRQLIEWGAEPMAFRAGNMSVGPWMYRELQAAGFRTASNIALAVYPLSDRSLMLESGVHLIDGVLELPVLTYRSAIGPGLKRVKALTIAGISGSNVEDVLDYAHKCGIGTAVVLMHPFDFVERDGDWAENIRPDPVTKGRFERLCARLAAKPDKYRVVTFGGEIADWSPTRLENSRQLVLPVHLFFKRLLYTAFDEVRAGLSCSAKEAKLA